MRSIKGFVTALSAVALMLLPFSSHAYMPFGGKIVTQFPCNTGFLLYIQSSKGIVPLMWMTGNLRYESYVVPHVGQQILGVAASAAAPCVLGVPPFATYFGAGAPIVYHGSSK